MNLFPKSQKDPSRKTVEQNVSNTEMYKDANTHSDTLGSKQNKNNQEKKFLY